MDSMHGILTKGLGSEACSALIFGPFRLFCDVTTVPPTGGVGVGGGYSVREGSKAHQIIVRRTEDVENTSNMYAEVALKRKLSISVVINGKAIEREYIVNKTVANLTFNMFKAIKKTQLLIKTTYVKITKRNK